MKCRAIAGAGLLGLTALLGACGGAKGAESEAAAAPEVGVVEIAPQSYEMTSELSGRVAAFQVSEVRPQIGGIVRARRFEEGASVRAGQVLYEIDPGAARTELTSAQAALASARARLERYQELIEIGAVSRQDVDDARAAADAASAALDSARVNEGYTRVLAPISGVIGASSVTPGALATPAQAAPFAVIQNIDRVYVDMTQSIADMMRLRETLAQNGESHARVRLILPDGREYAHDGELQFSEVSVNQSTGTVRLRALFPNPDHVLLPGMFVQTRLIEGVNQNAILAMQRGVTYNARGEAVALVLNRDGVVEQRVIETGATAGDKWVVRSGLNPGDRLIVDGLQHVHPGDHATPVNFDADGRQSAQHGGLALRGREGG